MLTLRSTVNVVTVLAAVGLVGGLGAFQMRETRNVEMVEELTLDVRAFQQMVHVRAATKDVELNGRGWPVTINPEWFNGDPPRNPLVSAERPWVEVAPPGDAHLSDPRVRIALDGRYASFWYNPYQGIVRARVPMKINDQLTLDLYNLVNGTTLPSIFRAFGEPEGPPKTTVATPAPEAPATETPATEPAPPPPILVDEMSSDSLDPTRPVEPAAAPEEPTPVTTPSAPPTQPPPTVAPKPKPKGGRAPKPPGR